MTRLDFLSSRMSGFVAFMNRKSAEEAMREMDGRLLHGTGIKIDWGKAIKLPKAPIWPPPATGAEKLPTKATHPKSITVAPPLEHPHPHIPDIQARHLLQYFLFHFILEINRVPYAQVKPPEDEGRQAEIDIVAAYVAQDGSTLEEMVMEREKDNPRFSFLFDRDSEEHAYYKWRVFAFVQGDTERGWRSDPFRMVHNGARWIPPEPPSTEKRERHAQRVHPPPSF